MNYLVFLLFGLVGLSIQAPAQSQCNGSFLYYDHALHFTGNPECWGCSYNYLPVVAIRVDTCCKNSYVFLAAYDSNGVRLPAPTVSGSTGGTPWGGTTINNEFWYGSLNPMWMGFTSPSWYFGRQGWVSVVAGSYDLTNCMYQGAITLRMKAFVWTPNVVGDTCYFDSAVTIPFCQPLHADTQAGDITPTVSLPPDTIRRFDMNGKDVGPKATGLVMLQLYTKERGHYYKKTYKGNW